MRIVHITSEAVPWAKTGGLADVAGALTAYLARGGHEVTLFLPLYRSIREAGFDLGSVDRELGPAELGVDASAAIRAVSAPDGLRLRLVEAPDLYDRDGLYGDRSGDHPDNLRRYSVLCRAALCSLDAAPDILHTHDWQTALAPVLLRAGPPPGATVLVESRPASVFTVHNLAYQGRFPASEWPLTGLPDEWYTPDRLEYYGGINLLKGGLIAADRVTTVSPTYAREISTPEFGFGLEGVIRALPRPVEGILNGIDTEVWNPAADPLLGHPYHPADLSGKAAAKRELQKEFDLYTDPSTPLFGFVSRLVDQKGMPLFEALAERLGGMPAQFVFLGRGEPRYEHLIEELGSRFGNVGARVTFSERLAHLIEAGSDFLLMPSAFEPCGLNQMISQRYGTVPIVHEIGGLADSVVPVNPETLKNGTATGIVFRTYDPEAFAAALESALGLFGRRAELRRVVEAGMRTDFSWDASGREYEQLYARMLDEAVDSTK